MSKSPLTELRNDLSAVARDLAGKGNGTTAREVVQAFHKERPELVRAASRMLIDTALTRLVGDVIKRRAGQAIDIEQSELFDRMIADIVAVSSSTTGAGRRDHYRVVGSLPVGLAEQMVNHHLQTRGRKKDRFDTYKDLLDHVAPFVTSKEMTLNEALAAARAANFGRNAERGR